MKVRFNQLWIRMALTFSVVQIVFIMLPFAVFGTLRHFDIVADQNFTEQAEAIFDGSGITQEQEAYLIKQVRREMRSDLPRELIQLVIGSGIVGLIAGIIVSRRLTRPLNELTTGAKNIGLRQLGYRIDTTMGSPEIQVVARAFNGMAERLGNSEQVRKNLLADVAHELRTPLTVVQGNLRAMLDGIYPINAEEIAGIFDQTLHLTRLVDDLHELAQAEAHQLQLNLQEVDVAELVQSCATAFRPLADEKSIELRPELLGKLPEISADRTRIAQALHNLINNALQHTPEKGTVTIQAEHVTENVEIRIRDTGNGIEPNHLPHVFDRFYRTDDSRQRHVDESGSGLGLAIVRAIIESHGGTVDVKSEGTNRGSLFTISLPTT